MNGQVTMRERLGRGVLGGLMLAWAYLGETPWGLLGILLIASAVSGWCAGYALHARLTGAGSGRP